MQTLGHIMKMTGGWRWSWKREQGPCPGWICLEPQLYSRDNKYPLQYLQEARDTAEGHWRITLRYLVIKRNETGSFVEMWMDPETFKKWSKSQREKYCMLMDICEIYKKWYIWPYLQNRNRDRDVENKHVDSKRGKVLAFLCHIPRGSGTSW